MPFKPKIYSIAPLDTAFVDSVTSEAAGHAIEKALDHNLDTFWQATTTGAQDIELDLGYTVTEQIITAADRDFSSDTGHWLNSGQPMTTFDVIGGALSMVSAGVGSQGYLAAAYCIDFVEGFTYTFKYDYSGDADSFRFHLPDGGPDYSSNLVVGTNQKLTVTATAASTLFYVQATAAAATGSIDNISVHKQRVESVVNGLALWIRNYDTDFGASHAVALDWSDNGSTWVSQADLLLQSEMTLGVGYPLRIYTWVTGAEHKYWRITLSDATTILDVGQLFLLQTHDPDISGYYPESEVRNYGNRITRLANRRLLMEPGYRTPVQVFNRRYRCFSDAARDTFIDAYDSARGGQTPMILNEGSDYYVCRFIGGTLNVTSIDFPVYDIPFKFETLPYIADGDVT